MSNLIIPDHRKKSFEILMSFNSDELNNLYREFEQAPPGLLSDSLSSYLSNKLSIDYTKIHSVVELLFELYRVKDTAQIEVLEFTEDIIEALKTEGFEPINNDWTSFQDILYKFIDIKSSIGLTQRARRLTNAYENIFIDSRIITDIRPIFKTDNSDEVETSLIVHQLKMTYRHNAKNKTIIFALDNEDLRLIKEVIVRAEKKEEVIKNSYKNSTNFLEFEK